MPTDTPTGSLPDCSPAIVPIDVFRPLAPLQAVLSRKSRVNERSRIISTKLPRQGLYSRKFAVTRVPWFVSVVSSLSSRLLTRVVKQERLPFACSRFLCPRLSLQNFPHLSQGCEQATFAVLTWSFLCPYPLLQTVGFTTWYMGI